MIQKWCKEIMEDIYFLELFKKAEEYSINTIFKNKKITFTEKEYYDLFRFADILSFSDNSEYKNISLKIISLLYEVSEFYKEFQIYSVSILSRLWNFPSIQMIDTEWNIEKMIPFDIFINKKIKEDKQQSPLWGKIFTDSQYKIYKELLNHNNFSFSWPTSLWKSFLMESYIFKMAETKKENIVLIVPTRALISQVSNKLKAEFKGKLPKYKILTHPIIPELFYNPDNNFIFVFTPERFINYLWDKNNPKISYLFVDEAHKIISERDSRSPLYYHALYQAQKKWINLFFASPNVPNPEIFLKIFWASQEDSLTTNENTVTQNRYFIDLIEQNIIFYSDLWNEYKIKNANIIFKNTFDIIYNIWNNTQNIIYCNSITNTIHYSLQFLKNLEDITDEEKLLKINKVIKIIKKELHQDYYLIPCLKKWVWFHFWAIPQRIRNLIEELFQEKTINYLFTTSTLLEWINLPAKNIFILNNKIWLSKFKSIDFWNLAWRAGRLTKELSWNIICIRESEKSWNKWKKIDYNIIKNKKIEKLKSQILEEKWNFYQNINNSISWQNFSKKQFSAVEKEIWDQYGNILIYHHKQDYTSKLVTNYNEKIKENKKLEKIAKEIVIPNHFLLISSNIKVKYQNDIYINSSNTLESLPKEINYENCKKLLNILYKEYNLKEEEDLWKNPMFPNYIDHKRRIEYFSTIMEKWLTSASLKQIISSTIKYKEKYGIIYINKKPEEFNKNNPIHINQIINDLISDIDYFLRYKFEKYFNNYYLILVEKLWENNAGYNWAEFLEYWTNDKKLIELQNIWLERHMAKFILENFNNYLEFNNIDNLSKFDYEKILKEMDDSTIEYQEFKQFVNDFIN